MTYRSLENSASQPTLQKSTLLPFLHSGRVCVRSSTVQGAIKPALILTLLLI